MDRADCLLEAQHRLGWRLHLHYYMPMDSTSSNWESERKGARKSLETIHSSILFIDSFLNFHITNGIPSLVRLFFQPTGKKKKKKMRPKVAHSLGLVFNSALARRYIFVFCRSFMSATTRQSSPVQSSRVCCLSQSSCSCVHCFCPSSSLLHRHPRLGISRCNISRGGDSIFAYAPL